MYDNQATGLQKASHERMLNDKGRKVVKEKIGDQLNSHDHYRNMREEDGHHFDQQWGQMAGQLGLGTSTANNRLGHGGGSSASHAIQYSADGRGAYNPNTGSISIFPDNRPANMRTIYPPRVNKAPVVFQPLQAAGPVAIINGNHAPV